MIFFRDHSGGEMLVLNHDEIERLTGAPRTFAREVFQQAAQPRAAVLAFEEEGIPKTVAVGSVSARLRLLEGAKMEMLRP